MAFSHRSTLGPRMKCCDSITSATAASTSALIAAYCPLRSSNGTFMSRFLLYYPVRLRALGEFRRQRSVIVEIETAKDTGFHFAIAIATLGACHHTVGIRRLE